jgi:hypothetical protein
MLTSLLVAHALATDPMLTHQGRLTDTAGAPIDGTVALRVSLFDTEASPSPFFTRLYASQPVQDGYFAVQILRNDANQPLDPDDFTDGEVWLGVEVGGQPAGARQRLGASPFSIASSQSASAEGPTIVRSDDGLRCLKLTLPASGYTLQQTAVDCTTGATIGLTQSGGVWSHAGNALQSCNAYKSSPLYVNQGSGLYLIDPDLTGTVAPMNAWCDMTTDSGGWTHVVHSNTAGAFTGSSTYQTGGNYRFNDVPPHTHIAMFVYRGGVLEAGIASAKMATYVPGQTGTSLIDYSSFTWEQWNSSWASYTGSSLSSCFHSTYQDLCFQSGYIGTCNSGSSYVHTASSSSWVSHSHCSLSGGKPDVNVIIAVR